MSWCEANDIDYVFGFAGNTVLDRLVQPEADDIRTRRARSKQFCAASPKRAMRQNPGPGSAVLWTHLGERG